MKLPPEVMNVSSMKGMVRGAVVVGNWSMNLDHAPFAAGKACMLLPGHETLLNELLTHHASKRSFQTVLRNFQKQVPNDVSDISETEEIYFAVRM